MSLYVSYTMHGVDHITYLNVHAHEKNISLRSQRIYLIMSLVLMFLFLISVLGRAWKEKWKRGEKKNVSSLLSVTTTCMTYLMHFQILQFLFSLSKLVLSYMEVKSFGKCCAEPLQAHTSKHIHTFWELMWCKGAECDDGRNGRGGPA